VNEGLPGRLGGSISVSEAPSMRKSTDKTDKGVGKGSFVLFEDSEVHSRRLLQTSPTLLQSWVHLDHFGGPPTCFPLDHPNQMMVSQNSEASVDLFDPLEQMRLVGPETVPF
jgi:hypothetical protein